MIPFILYASLKVGELLTKQETNFALSDVSFDVIKNNMHVYLLGSSVLAVAAAIFMGLLTFLILLLIKKLTKKEIA
jgi:uncharacterized protein (DUF2062 family)